MKAFNKGFDRAINQWIWIPPEEIEAKKIIAKDLMPVPNIQRFCYNNQFRVMFFDRQTVWELIQHLMITQHNGRKIVDHWATLQQIKNELVGNENLAIEIYPPNSELVNDMNAYHLWVLPIGFKLPFRLSAGWCGFDKTTY